MNILIILALVVVGFFAVIFIAGFVMAMFVGSEKQMKSWAKGFLDSNLSEKEQKAIASIWNAFQTNNAQEAENVLDLLSSEEIANLKKICSPNARPVEFSSGEAGDKLSWAAWLNEAKERGFSETSSHIIAGIGLNGYK